ncbi:MAG: beta-lactamase family protein [Rubrivivax sp.]|nr:beta-lactamase family protein [Rubrivivax sp.]
MNSIRLGSRRPRFFALLALLSLQACAQVSPGLDTARIDAVFAAFTEKTPGCALGISQGGRTIHAKGYGLADLGHGMAIRPDTVFDIGSVSKQFTAVALLLLEEDGKLKLDDSLQQHLPELAQAFPQRISLRQLLEHTAGLRDYNELLLFAGQAEENVTGDAEALRAILAVPERNFAPGTRWSYSNTGYFLAAQVAQRVSGLSLDALLQARLFKPLGMAATHVRTNHLQVVPRRATAYQPGEAPGVYLLNMSNWNQAGDGAVQSTVLDLARWDAELGDPKVLSQSLVRALRTPGRLSDGTPITYALGQISNEYRGQPRVSHGGTWGGYRAMLAHFPAQRAGIAITCNVANANVPALLNQVADLVLAKDLTEAAPALDAAVPPGFDAQRFAGSYLHEDGFAALRLNPEAQPGQVRMHIGFGNSLLRSAASDTLQNASGTLHLTLSTDGSALRLTRRADPHRVDRYLRLPSFSGEASALSGLAGSYRQTALGSSLRLEAGKDGALRLQIGSAPAQGPLQALAADLLVGPGVLLRVERDAKGQVQALVYSSERVRRLRYTRD